MLKKNGIWDNFIANKEPVRKPRLIQTMIENRLDWAQKYKDFTTEDWKKVKYI